MKKINLLILIILVIFTSCKKEVKNVSQVVNVTYPKIVLKGPAYVHLPVGGSYSDEGATLTDDISGAVSQISATQSYVDFSTPGLYPIKYVAANKNGFNTTVI